ncbi:unnamed protein product [Albugo candida]|nr:unnamed protein product [Albugo candida]|eukprot:CCI42017.1 unnamed protein product [Albugo candida]
MSIEEATKIFQELQHAYRVLINPHERNWYDNHRDQLLQYDRDASAEDGSIMFDHYTRDSAFKGYNDHQKGFFAVYSAAFQHIVDLEEIEEGLPKFGNVTDELGSVQDFYVKWMSFSTKRSFSWMNIYSTTEVTTRIFRRAAEKENKRRRERAKKNYNQKVRELVKFVRKRDSRILEFEQEKASQRESQRTFKAQRNLAKKAAYEQAKISFQRQQLEAWERNHVDSSAGEPEKTGSEQYLNGALPDWVQYPDDAQLSCVVCDKTFNTDKQLRNHLYSKKHGEIVAMMKLDGHLDNLVSTKIGIDDLQTRFSPFNVIDETKMPDQVGEQDNFLEKTMSPVSSDEKMVDTKEKRLARELRAAEKRRERKEQRKLEKRQERNVLTHLERSQSTK